MVSVRCMTYNQSAYIIDALKGFCLQQTSFPFLAIVMDDASTDGEQVVIEDFINGNFLLSDISCKKWETEEAKWIFAQHRENPNCSFLVVFLKRNLYKQKQFKLELIKEWEDKSKYIALCEGDDYWTDPLKLQKQVDFLEAHNEYSLCCHRYKIYNQNGGNWEDGHVNECLFEKHPEGFSFDNAENINGWFTVTLTLMYRRDCYDSSDLKYKYRCDVHLNYHLLKKGMGYCLPFMGAVYRRCDSGVYSGLIESEKVKRWCRIRGEMLEYNILDTDLRNHVYFGLRDYLNNRWVYREEFKVILVCLKSFYKTEGFWTMLRAVWKFLKSYVYGLKTKKEMYSDGSTFIFYTYCQL